MSVLNQNNKSLSRLAIISKHVAADKRKRFGTVWVDFCQEDFSSFIPDSFFRYLFIPFENDPSLHTVSPCFLQACLLQESTMLCWFRGVLMLMGDVQWEEPAA